MKSLPAFDDDGLLPPGDYKMTFREIYRSILVHGPKGAKFWAQDWRRELVGNLEILVGHLVKVGVKNVFVDGSFVEERDVPNDIDGYFACEPTSWQSGELPKRLAEVDPVWTWEVASRRTFRGYAKPQLPMWHKYRVELFPDYGQFCGLTDRDGRPLRFAQAFRQSRDFKPKGIITIGGLR